MNIGFFIKWNKNSLKSNDNVVGDELFANSLCKSIKNQYKSINAELYAPNYLPKNKLDVMIYLNESVPNEKFSRFHLRYIQNGTEEKLDDLISNIKLLVEELDSYAADINYITTINAIIDANKLDQFDAFSYSINNS